MQCPACGSQNHSHHHFCILCGASLKTTSNMEEKAQERTVVRKELLQNKKDWSQEFDLYDDSSLFPDSSPYINPTSNRYNISEQLPLRRYRKEKKNCRRRKWRIFTGTFVWLTLACFAIYGTVVGLSYIKKVLPQANLISEGDGSTEKQRVEVYNDKDKRAHHIRFWVQDGEYIWIEETGQKYYLDKTGFVDVMIEDSFWLKDSEEIISDVIQVEIKAIVYKDGKQVTELTVPPFEVEVPLSPFSLVHPDSFHIKTTENQCLLKLQVIPGSRVFIGENEYTDLIDTEGYIELNIPIESSGIHKTPILVESKNHRANKKELIIERPPMEISLSIDLTLPKKTENSSILVTGTTEPDAVLTTNIETIGGIKVDPNTGAFKFTAKLERYGINTITITASKENKADSQLSYRIERVPNLSEYTRKAWKMDYQALLGNPGPLQGKIFLCEGKVVKITKQGERTLFLFDVGTEAENIIAMEYGGDMKLTEGETYRIFGDLDGTYESYPRIIARFLYLKE
ncbi:MAG: hypothetical protein ACOX6S_12365 [Clostridia bacterium]